MTQKTWLITGVNSGFGRLMTEALLERGDRVAGTVRKLDAMNDLKAKYGERLWLANLDMTDLPAVRSVVDQAFVELGTIDVIVSNAGYGFFGAAEELSDEQVAHQLSTNLFGPIQLIRSALPHLRAQGGASGRFPLPCEQMGTGRLSGFNRSRTRAVQNRRDDHRAGRRPHELPLWRCAAWHATRSLQGHPGCDGPHDDQRHFAPSPGDPAKMVKIIVDSVDQNPAPKRIALGSDAYGAIHKALTDRLSALEAQRDAALFTDFPKDEQRAKHSA